MTEKQDRLRLQEQIRRTQHKVVDALESIVDRLSTQPAPARSLAAERRQVANLLGACSSAPSGPAAARIAASASPCNACACIPLLDAGPLAGLLQGRKRPRQPRASAVP
jgi:hypothetical protein